MKKAVIILAVILGVLLLGNCGSEYDAEDWGQYYDWGNSHYWNSQSHSVEVIPWKAP